MSEPTRPRAIDLSVYILHAARKLPDRLRNERGALAIAREFLWVNPEYRQIADAPEVARRLLIAASSAGFASYRARCRHCGAARFHVRSIPRDKDAVVLTCPCDAPPILEQVRYVIWTSPESRVLGTRADLEGLLDLTSTGESIEAEQP